MPWDAESFKAHNKKLHGHSAVVGAAAATNALKEGLSEGSAVRIGNAAGDKALRKKPKKSALKHLGMAKR
jgi:hypothetical protein